MDIALESCLKLGRELAKCLVMMRADMGRQQGQGEAL